MTDHFRRLLHKISAKLDERDLKSLISLCNVCESRRAEITDGMKLFEHLMQRDVISEEKIIELKKLLKSLYPRRRDLVSLVNIYMGLSPTEDDDRSEIVTISRSVSTQKVQSNESNRTKQPKPCCTLNFPCLKVFFYKLHSCYVALLVFFVIVIAICCSFWYGNVPRISKYLRANEDTKNAGVYVLLTIILVCFPVSIFCVFYVLCAFKRRRKAGKGNNKAFTPKKAASGDADMNMCPPTSSYDNPGNTVNEESPSSPSNAYGISDDDDKGRVVNVKDHKL